MHSPSTIVVCGANSGVGLSLCETLLTDGYRVVGLSLHSDKMKRINNDNFIFYTLDFANSSSVQEVFAELGPINGLVNCAAVFEASDFKSQSFLSIGKIIDTNLKGTILTCRCALDIMSKGHIINISSVSGCYGIERQAVYSATKHALRGFGESLNKELIPQGIKVTTLFPGGIDTPLWNQRNPYNGDTKSLLKTSDISDIILMILKSKPHIVFKELVFFPDNEIH